MKRSVILWLLLLSIQASGREVFNINRGWKFFSNSEVTSDAATTVNLPHTWNRDALGGKRDYFRGIGNYLKHINIPEEWRGRRVFLKCYGANSVATVLINSRHAGEHRGGYTSFTYEITDYLNFGRDNLFWIIVNNSPQSDVLPTAGDANSYGGLFRDVELIVTGEEIVSVTDYATDGIYVAQKRVSRDQVEAEASVKVVGVRDEVVMAELAVFTDEMDTVAHGDARVKLNGRMPSTAHIPFSIGNPVLWDGVNNPFLYNVGVKILKDDVVTDSVVVKTGFRYFSVDPQQGFMLNGIPYPIKGAVVHQDRALMGTAIVPYQVKEDFDLIRGMGVNMVRVADVVHNPEFYELCDKYGILVWSDFPLVGAAYLTDKGFLDTQAFCDNGKQQALEIIRQQYNHPSVVMWGIFSKLSMRGDNPSDYIVELNSLAKREDPSRLTVATSNEDGDINFITDLVVWSHFFGWREGLPEDINIWRNQFRANWKDMLSGVTYEAGGSIFHQEDSLYRPSFRGNWHPERWQTHLHEVYFNSLKGDSLFWGLFVSNMFDYGAAGHAWGEGKGINDYGMVTFDRKYCKDAYYFYKANWNTTDPFVYISERRWDKRRQRNQNVRVYSNQDEVELFVNGISQGRHTGTNGLFLWENVLFDDGENVLEVRSGDSYDRVVIEILNSSSKSQII